MKVFLLLNLVSALALASSAKGQSLCNRVFIATEIVEKKSNGTERLAELWDDNNPDRTTETRPSPNVFYVRSYITNPESLGAEPWDFIYITVSVSIKYGISPYCLEPMNSQITKGTNVVLRKKVSRTDFNTKPVKGVVSPLVIKSNDFNLKEILEEYKINFEDTYLNQILISTTIDSGDQKPRCTQEYAQPMCVKRQTLRN